MNKLDKIVENLKNKNVAVVGDLILDVYVKGKASRISPEAPVPVLQVKSRNYELGGAANVMRNIKSLGAEAEAFGAVGNDEHGKILKKMLNDSGIANKSVFTVKNRCTTDKQRIMAGNQQLVRIDYESCSEIPEKIRNEICESLIQLIKNKSVDAIIFEDYAKGILESAMIQKVIDESEKSGILTALDPHPGHPMNIKGITIMTPNRSEAFGLAGLYNSDPVNPPEKDRDLMIVADKIMEKWNPEYLLITLGAQGIFLMNKKGDFLVIPTKAREVFDVSGAGDTVIAAFTLAVLSGASQKESAEFANHAAGVVVGKVGTVAVEIGELIDSFKNNK